MAHNGQQNDANEPLNGGQCCFSYFDSN